MDSISCPKSVALRIESLREKRVVRDALIAPYDDRTTGTVGHDLWGVLFTCIDAHRYAGVTPQTDAVCVESLSVDIIIAVSVVCPRDDDPTATVSTGGME